jgi:hypothetical protein
MKIAFEKWKANHPEVRHKQLPAAPGPARAG